MSEEKSDYVAGRESDSWHIYDNEAAMMRDAVLRCQNKIKKLKKENKRLKRALMGGE